MTSPFNGHEFKQTLGDSEGRGSLEVKEGKSMGLRGMLSLVTKLNKRTAGDNILEIQRSQLP